MAGYIETLRLMNGTTIRALHLAVRGATRRFNPPQAPDPALLEVVDRPFESVALVADRLSRLEAILREHGDRRAVFLTIYTQMTREVAAGIEEGQFANPDWMRRYLIAFANYYRRAFVAFERGRLTDVPAPWRIAFGAALHGDTLIIQDALLGVNAHINYDLALAISEIGIDPDRDTKYADHRRINDILRRLIDAQQAALSDLYAAGIDDFDTMAGRLDESLMLLSMTNGREQAWRIAVILADVGIELVSSYARWVLRTTATGGAVFTLSPHIEPATLRVLRHIESDGVDLKSVLDQIDDYIN